MFREATAKLEAWTEQPAKAPTAKVKRFAQR
jgi:hypothetical protein